MIRNLSIMGVMLILLVSACSPQAPSTPTVSPLDIQHTAEAAAFTMVAQTEEAMPTNTPLPPTEKATETSLPTLTSLPSLTADPSQPTATGLPTLAANLTLGTSTAAQTSPDSSNSTAEACNKPLTSWKDPTANFTLKNETKPQGEIVMSLYVVTPLGDCGYLTDLSRGPVGMYSAGAFVNGQKNFKVFGGFQIQQGNWKIVVRNDKIIAMGSCYPNC